jgi:hypothetical protein
MVKIVMAVALVISETVVVHALILKIKWVM